jgi:CubicO group peptidase (beta-lactamase class C family)
MISIFSDLIASAQAQNLQILNVIVRQHGEIIARHDFAPEKPVLLWSASKTFVSMAVGIAQAEGLFSINDPLLEYFHPEGEVNDNLQHLRVRDLLCMGAGHRVDPVSAALEKGESVDDIESLFFAEPFVDAPGTRFKYDNSATYMLSKLITKRSGLNLRDYLLPRLFNPLSIETPHWESDSASIAFGCSGLYLNATDLSKFGQLLLNLGEWQSKQLIPREYVVQATRQQISTADFNEPFATADYRSGYGYQMWMNRIPGTWRVDGLYGQYIIGLPEQGATVTYISNEPEKMTSIIELTWNNLLHSL